MTTRRATDNTKALDAFMATKFQIDAMQERLKALSDDHFNTHPDEINWGHVGTLNHLPRETFEAEAKLAADLEGQSPGILRKIAESMGMGTDFAKWEASHAA